MIIKISDADSLQQQMTEDLAENARMNEENGGDIMGPGPADYQDDPRYPAWFEKYGDKDE